MRKLARTANAPPLFAVIFAVAAALSPFNAAYSMSWFGELGGDPFSTILLIAAPLLIVSVMRFHALRLSPSLLAAALAFALCIAISYAVNFDEINAASLRGRSGLEKMATSTAVVLSGFFFAVVADSVTRWDVERYFVKPLLWSGLLVIVFGALQFAAWHSGAASAIFDALSRYIHAAIGREGYIASRISSVTLEPSFFGAYVGVFLPLMLREVSLRGSWLRSGGWAVMTVALVGLCMLSGRTAQVAAPTAIFSFAAFVILLRTRQFLLSKALVALAVPSVCLAPLCYILLYDEQILNAIINSNTDSNVSRYGTISILVELFRERPLFGVGFGQYGFHVPTHLEGWADNWEFRRWMENPSASFFPSFSVIARIAGELGAGGLIVWTALLTALALGCCDQATKARLAGLNPLMGASAVAAIFCVAVYCWTAGGFKGVYVWGVLGFAAGYARVGARLEQAVSAARTFSSPPAVQLSGAR